MCMLQFLCLLIDQDIKQNKRKYEHVETYLYVHPSINNTTRMPGAHLQVSEEIALFGIKANILKKTVVATNKYFISSSCTDF